MKKFLALILTVLMVSVVAVPALAAGPTITATSQSCTHPAGSSAVSGSGYMTTNVAGDLNIELILQKLNGSSWSNQNSDNSGGYGVTSKSYGRTWTVSSGTYRVKVVYTATNSGGTSTVTKYTASVTF